MKCVVDKSSLIIKIVALKWLIFAVLNWIEKFNGSRFIHAFQTQRKTNYLNKCYYFFDEVFLDAFTIRIYIN